MSIVGAVFSFFRYDKRPFVGDDTTARLAYVKPFDYPLASATGPQGVNVKSNLNPFFHPSVAGQGLVFNDPTVTGNPSTTLSVMPLSQTPEQQNGAASRQF